MMPDEVRKMDNKKCLIFIRGFDPILDDKFSPFGHPMFAQSADGEGEPYVHVRNSVSEDSVTEPAFTILNDKALSYYEELQKKGEQVYIDKLSYEEFLLLGQVDLKKRFMDMDEAQTVEEFHEEQAKELMYAQDEKEEASNNIPYRLMHIRQSFAGKVTVSLPDIMAAAGECILLIYATLKPGRRSCLRIERRKSANTR